VKNESIAPSRPASGAQGPSRTPLGAAVRRLSREQLVLALVAAREGRLHDVDALLAEAAVPAVDPAPFVCRRCRHTWPRAASRPTRCPACRRPRWWAAGPLAA
jgi:hypothetical protein